MERFGHGGEIPSGTKIKYDFSVNINPLGMPESVRQELIRFIESDNAAAYPDPHCRQLRDYIAEAENVSADQILCGNGASELIMSICAWKKSKKVLLFAPTFSEYERCARLYGAEITYCSDISEFPALAAEHDLVFICNPNNPTGELVKDNMIEETARAASENGNILVVDECFIDFTHGQSSVRLIEQYKGLIVLKAFTKFYGFAGLRLGYMLSGKEIREAVEPYCSRWNVSSLAQRAGCAALKEKDWKEKTLHLIDTEREYLIHAIRAIGAVRVFPSDSNFILIKTEQRIFDNLLENQIFVRDCSNFQGLDDTYIRICVSSHSENEIFVKALKEVIHG